MEKIDLQKKKILVVEDEEGNWFILRDIIKLCNGAPLWAESGMKAIQLVKEDPGIRFVFMDLKLPFMSGNEATKEIKKLRPELPIIVQTALVDQKHLNANLPEECDGYILKPLNFDETVMSMKNHLVSGD